MSDLITQLRDVRRMVQLKHQPGRHAQDLHTPHRYSRAAGASAVEGSGTARQKDMVATALEGLPESHTDMIANVVVVDAKNLRGSIPQEVMDQYRFGDKQLMGVRGMGDYKNGVLYVAGRADSYGSLKRVVHHEAAHMVFQSEGQPESVKVARAQLRNLHGSGEMVSGHALGKSANEFVAEAYTMYHNDPSGLKRRSPKTYGVMRNLESQG